VNLECISYVPFDELNEEELPLFIKSFSRLPKLAEIHIGRGIDEVAAPALKYLSKCSSLRSLTLDTLLADTEEYEFITFITQLTQLKVWSAYIPKQTSFLYKLKYLRSFEDRETSFNTKEIITSLTNLEDLYIRSLSIEYTETMQTSMLYLTSLTMEYAAALEIVTELTKLTQLHLLQLATLPHENVNQSVIEDLRSIPCVRVVNYYNYNRDLLEDYETKYLN